ncbi:MAG: hypothetical protein A3B68_08845 [Candidatus Melainabacteria bacterium RIFCSPHIGHO2_02_FULL_34_12]|nr:MAG: hypothetical protein A3B68_08845 [Candidatus Melainabacteria bacterium RIFCSPHIGHO2_02_FULL_34_12]
MKKLIVISFVLVLVLYNFNILSRAQDSSVSGEEGGNFVLGLIEDSIIRDASQEMSDILKDLAAEARRSGQSRDLKPLIRNIKRNLAALNHANRSLPPNKCAITLDINSLQRLSARLDKLDDNLCDSHNPAPSRLTFDFMFEQKTCVVGSPDFLKCICPHRPKYPGCDCLENRDFEPIFDSLADRYETIANAALVDTDMNGFPDACENNRGLPEN